MTETREVYKESVANSEKPVSIYEQHTDIIVKGGREVEFGHKMNLSTGKSKLILSCEILSGNPSDTELYQTTIDKVVTDYQIIPRDIVTDGVMRQKPIRNMHRELELSTWYLIR